MSAETPSIEERLAAVMAAEAKSDAAEKSEEQERTLAYYELKQRLSWELGKMGRDFHIFNTVEGLVAVKRVDAIHVKQYDDATVKCRADGKAVSTAILLAFSTPGVIVPEPATYRTWVLGTKDRPGADGIAVLAANAIQRLHGAVEVEVHGKQ